MHKFDRIDINRKWPIPPWIKFVLLIAFVLGLLIRGCWVRSHQEQFTISDVELGQVTSASIDVRFTVANHTTLASNPAVYIRVFNTRGEVVASRITAVLIEARTRKRYLRTMDKIMIPYSSIEEITHATVELYIPSILD
jgi:hypothetical protein